MTGDLSAACDQLSDCDGKPVRPTRQLQGFTDVQKVVWNACQDGDALLGRDGIAQWDSRGKYTISSISFIFPNFMA